MKKLAPVALLAASTIAISAPAAAEQYYGFMDVSVNFLDWTAETERLTNDGKRDFLFLEVEGGAGFDWGDLYGFFDLENPGNVGQDKEGKNNNFRIATKGSIAVNLGDSNWNAYSHVYHFEDAGFYDTNVVLGVSYDVFTESGFWIKPFLGAHIENQTFAGNGFNGYMTGWVLGYDFQVGTQKFSVNQWHETEFGRKDQFASGPFKTVGHNGAVSAWWHIDQNFTVGLQYRYADHKLGTPGFQDAIIYTAKYNF
ncbi:outer membrane protein OmpK [Thalassotalea aquiviva]|uniref:outer membrane protein OmpK n=1 Tax=Thalassotalea aquiviva TaxID=3242415 RepID=UPI00352A9690